MTGSLKDLKSNPTWNSKRAMRDHCVELLGALDAALALTTPQVHLRKTFARSFELEQGARLRPESMGNSKARPGTKRPSTESLLESAIFDRYRPGTEVVSGPSRYFIARQVALYKQKDSEGWGKIDILGMTTDGEPVIVELKKASSHDTPLHALLEAACYAVSLRLNWPLLAKEIKQVYRGLSVAANPRFISLHLMAPETFWEGYKRWSSSGGGVPRDTQSAFAKLCEGFAKRGLPVTASIVRYPTAWNERSPISPGNISIEQLW